MPTTLEQPSELVNLLRLTRQPEVRLGTAPEGWEDFLPEDEPLRLGDWPITVYEAADYLRLPADDSHELIKYLIAGACAIVESYTGRGLTIARWLQRSILQRGFVTFVRAPVGNYKDEVPRKITGAYELEYCSTLVHPQLDLVDADALMDGDDIPEINGVLDRNFRGRATKLKKIGSPDDKVGKLTYSYNAWGLFCRGYDITIDYWGGYADPKHIEPDLKYAVLVLVYYGFSNPYEMNQIFENSGVKDLLRHYVPKTGEDENY